LGFNTKHIEKRTPKAYRNTSSIHISSTIFIDGQKSMVEKKTEKQSGEKKYNPEKPFQKSCQ